MLKLKRSPRTMMKVDRKISSSRLDFERIRRRDDTQDMKTGKEVRKTDSLVFDNPVNTTSSSCTSSPLRLTKHYTRHHKDSLRYPLLLVVVLFIIISWSDRFTGIKADLPSLSSGAWDSWWAYDGISGPEYWGLINPEWSLCSKGKRQSPIDIKPDQLLYDPTLESIQFVGNLINGTIENTGRGVVFQVNQTIDTSWKVIINRGPLSYNYTLHHLMLHYGSENVHGSEHTIDGSPFPAEVQLFAFNSQLYSSWMEAESRPNGITAVSILVLLADYDHQPKESKQIKIMSDSLKLSANKGQPHSVTGFSIQSLLPSNTRHYMTYEGSLTQPPCHENVEWIILNRPLYTSIQDLRIIRNSITGADNFRPIQRTNIRTIRTNIDFVSTSSKEQDSSRSNVERIAGNVENKKKGDNSSKTCSITRFASYKSVVRQYKEPSTSH